MQTANPLDGGWPAGPASTSSASTHSYQDANQTTTAKIPCELCWQLFNTHEDILIHSAAEHDGRVACTQCRRMFESDDALRGHLEIAHPPTITCVQCPVAFYSEEDMWEHFEDIHDYIACTRCPMRFHGKKNVRTHFQEAHGSYYSHVCGKCRRQFQTAEKLKDHQALLGHEDVVTCDKCPSRFLDQESLEKHVAFCHSSHPCARCNLTFRTEEEAKTHELEEHEKKFPCTHCKAVTYMKKANLKEHLKSCQRLPLNSAVCPTCNSKFSKRADMVQHFQDTKCCSATTSPQASSAPTVRPATPQAAPATPPLTPPSTPKANQNSAKTPASPTSNSPGKIFRCTTCVRDFKSASALQDHCDAVHDSVEYRCCDCNQTWSNYIEFEKHLPSCVLVPKHKCNGCGISFQTEKMLAAHADECKPVSCLTKGCKRMFKKTQHMIQHLESGTCGGLGRRAIHELIAKHDQNHTLTIPGALEANNFIATTAGANVPSLENSTPTVLLPHSSNAAGDDAESDSDSDSDSGVELILTPSASGYSSPGGTGVPLSGLWTPTTPASSSSLNLEMLVDPTSCPLCGKVFISELAAQQHKNSAVHDLPRYRCPSDMFFTGLDLEVEELGHEKEFKTLAGLVGHLEGKRCRKGVDWKRVVGVLLEKVMGGGEGVKALMGVVG